MEMRFKPRTPRRQNIVYGSTGPRSLFQGAEYYDPDTESLERMAGKSVQQISGAYLPLSGGTLTGNLTMGNNSISLGASGAFGIGGVTPSAQKTKIADPSGGGTQDAEARTAINSIIDALEAFGFTSST